MKLEGVYPALITPFKRGMLDEIALRHLVRHLIRGSCAGLVPCGSTGEAATLSPGEYRRVISIVIQEARGQVPVIAGVGTNATEKAREMAQVAAGLGADALLVLTPYYNKPTQEGIFQHFQSVAKTVRIPIIVYNIPGRTGINVQPATLARLARACANVIATKEASGSLDQSSEILNLCPSGFTILSGDDSLTLPLMSIGAKGVISVIANILPKDVVGLCSAALKGNFKGAQRLHAKLFPLVKTLFIETNPIPIKAAAAMMGLCENELRLPLTPISADNQRVLAKALRAYGCL